jgi:hypothetical protein
MGVYAGLRLRVGAPSIPGLYGVRLLTKSEMSLCPESEPEQSVMACESGTADASM